MAKESVGISAAVGTRHGKTTLPNLSGDLATIAALFDRIPSVKGGTSDIPGSWPTERGALITEVTRQISVFQSINRPAGSDSAIDPGGVALRLMNQLAADPPLSAVVDPRPANVGKDDATDFTSYATSASMPGTAPLEVGSQATSYSRRLVRATGSSITWFGVVMPAAVSSTAGMAIPHVFFTPTPIQGGYQDRNYDSFTGWGKLWDDYTSRIGGLVTASGVQQILVIPFYKTSQAYGLGSFLSNWREVIAAVVTAAINDINPYYLRDTYSFSRLYSSSFSNGVNAHQAFNNHGTGAKAMTTMVFDLDGQAQTGGSHWRPPNGVIYHNRAAPRSVNPDGFNWYVGGRWSAFDKIQPETSRYSHHACSQFLLYHGLRQYCK